MERGEFLVRDSKGRDIQVGRVHVGKKGIEKQQERRSKKKCEKHNKKGSALPKNGRQNDEKGWSKNFGDSKLHH